MRENRNIVVPVNILTPLRAPRFLGPHDTLPCVLISTNKNVQSNLHNYKLQNVQ